MVYSLITYTNIHANKACRHTKNKTYYTTSHLKNEDNKENAMYWGCHGGEWRLPSSGILQNFGTYLLDPMASYPKRQ
jgi:hypothetical protein